MSSAPASPAKALPERELERSLEFNIAAGAVGMFWLAVSGGMALPLLMEAVKASGFQLGVLAAVRQFSMLIQLPTVLVLEHLSRRKAVWAWLAIFHRALWLVPVLLPVCLPNQPALWPILIIVSLGISDLLGNASASLWFGWMADLLPPGRAGRFWGARQRILSLFLLVASLIFALILEAWNGRGFLGFQIVFAAAAVFGIGDIILHLAVHEPEPSRAIRSERLSARLLAPLRDRDFRRLTLAMGIWTAAVTMPGYASGLPSFFSVVYLKESFGANYLESSWVFIASALGGILWTPKIGHWIDRRGARHAMIALMAAGPLFTLSWLFVSPARVSLATFGLGNIPQPILLLSAAAIFIGGAYAGVTLCQIRLTQVLSANSGRTVAMGVHWSLVGLMGSLGALSAGWLKDHLHLSATPLLPGLAPFSYFQVLVLIQVLLIWALALPLAARISVSALELPRTLEPTQGPVSTAGV